MLRACSSRLRYLQARTHGRRDVATSTIKFSDTGIAKESSSGGLLSWLTGSKSSSLPSLAFPLPGVKLPSSLPDYIEPTTTNITTLPNGLKVASESLSSPTASIGLYIDSGSVYETPLSSGATHLLERMAFKTSRNRSHFRMVREVEAIGGNVAASASREQMGYTFDALKTFVPQMVELLIDSVRNPAFLDWEVKEQLARVNSEIAEISNNPQSLLLEALHSAGYSGALQNPLLAPESAINRLNGSILEEFVSENFTAPRMVLAASGVDHQHLLSVAEPLVSDLPHVPCPEVPKSEYVGGEFRCQANSPMTHFALAFEVPGGWHKEKDAIALTVLQTLMGGGGSFSAGGPGKGMHSRLYLQVLNRYPQVQSFSAFNSMYNDSGLFGIFATTRPNFVSQAVELGARELFAVATPGKVTEVELTRAKNSTRSAVLMNLESRMVVTEDIGRQILTYGQRKPVEHFLNVLNEITLNDVASIAQKILSTPLTMATWGDVVNVPSYDAVNRLFHAK